MAVYNGTIPVNELAIVYDLPRKWTYPGQPKLRNYGEIPFYAASTDGNDSPNRIWIQYLNNNSLNPIPASTSSSSLLEQTDAWQTIKAPYRALHTLNT